MRFRATPQQYTPSIWKARKRWSPSCVQKSVCKPYTAHTRQSTRSPSTPLPLALMPCCSVLLATECAISSSFSSAATALRASASSAASSAARASAASAADAVSACRSLSVCNVKQAQLQCERSAQRPTVTLQSHRMVWEGAP